MSLTVERYEKSWAKYPSVTEVLECLAKPGLMHWFKNTPADEIKKISDDAKNIGTIVHESIGKILRHEKFDLVSEHGTEIVSCLKAATQFITDFEIENVIECELKMVDEQLGYKGTLDHIVQSKKYGSILIDWKTSKRLSVENDVQVIAYLELYLRLSNAITIDHCYVVRLDKLTGLYEAHKITFSYSDLFKIFKNLLYTKKMIKQLEEHNKCHQ